MSTRILIAMAVLAALAVPNVASAQPRILGVLNGASYSNVLAPGCWAVIYGTDLATYEATAAGLPLSTMLGERIVTFGGVQAQLTYVSPGQINALVPFEVSVPESGGAVTMSLRSLAGEIASYQLRLSRNAPALFARNSAGTGRAHVFDPSFQPVETVADKDALILYATGLGATNPPSPDGAGAAAEPLNRVADAVDVFLGDQRAYVLYAGLAPGFPGVYQLNVQANALVTDRIYLRSKNWQSNILDVGTQPGGANVANVSGAIEALYPSSNPTAPPFFLPAAMYPFTSTALFQAAAFKVSFDILPDAKPFSVAAVSEAGSSIIRIDPTTNTFEALTTVPSVAARNGDFSSFGYPILDFRTLRSTAPVCDPFPGNQLPVSRMDPGFLKATNLLAMPSAPADGGGVVVNRTTGPLRTADRFVVDDQNDGAIARFGGFLRAECGPTKSRVAQFRLYVDGRLIASTDVAYPAAPQ